ncbi:MAG: bifunctional adenosylcobinamide kinase/adenosylcobinamide-phosphate guanylyltransferase [Clostridia bacterium]|nr:bifunctional adenosylcobinamide kinase/adenosylcobinamide-phosphate guanylyltransferase [Clostridia bacterium]
MLTMLIGGSGCGKSVFGEALAAKMAPPRYYIATMRPYGEESLARIQRHRAQRSPLGFETFDRYKDVGSLVLPQPGTVLLECLCNLTANEMFDKDGAEASVEESVETVLSGVEALYGQATHLIVITNDVGSDGAQYGESTMRYMRALGKINALLAKKADHVAELVCGIPLWLKGEVI